MRITLVRWVSPWACTASPTLARMLTRPTNAVRLGLTNTAVTKGGVVSSPVTCSPGPMATSVMTMASTASRPTMIAAGCSGTTIGVDEDAAGEGSVAMGKPGTSSSMPAFRGRCDVAAMRQGVAQPVPLWAPCTAREWRYPLCALRGFVLRTTVDHQPRPRRSWMRVALLPALAIVLVMTLASCTPTRGTDYTKAILFVHGYNFSPAGRLRRHLRHHGERPEGGGLHRPDGHHRLLLGRHQLQRNLHDYGNFGDRDSWKNIAMAFSTYVYNTYTSKGIAVDVVGYSMGAQWPAVRSTAPRPPPAASASRSTCRTTSASAARMPARAWYTYGCLWGQCSSMKPGSDDINWLNTNRDPQGVDGTDITQIGSQADTTVPYASATFSMTLPATNTDVFTTVTHSGSDNYTHDAAVIARTGLALANPGE